MHLHGRTAELAVVTGLLDAARSGSSSALVIRGDAGIGKSALLERAVAAAGDMRVLRAVGVEAESALPFAGLHLLLGRHAGRADALPPAQARALRGALGLGDGRPDEGCGRGPFAIGLAVLTLLADLAEESPVLCVVDDAHWLDTASADALRFAARRLGCEGVVMLFAAREGHAPAFAAPGMDELNLAPLAPDAAAAVLAEHAADLSRHARELVLEEARGNPLALRELPAARRECGAGDRRVTTAVPRLQQTFADRIGALPAATRTLLLVAAAEGTGDLTVVAPAAAALGAGIDAAGPAEERDLIHLDSGRLTFRHPLVRSAAYQSAPIAERLAAHRALADALPCLGNIDRRVWHLAQATTAPDEQVAAMLERTAGHARARGGYAAVAAALERAAGLTPATADRARRLALAADAATDAGEPRRAAELAEMAAPYVADPRLRARLALARAAMARHGGQLAESASVLADAASEVAPVAPDTAAYLMFEAVTAAWLGGHGAEVRATAARVARADHPVTDAGRPFVDAARALANLASGDHAPAVASLHALVSALRENGLGLSLREQVTVAAWTHATGDLALADELAASLESQARAQGAPGVLPLVLMLRARTQILTGRHREAMAGAVDGAAVARDVGQEHYAAQLDAVRAYLAALAGDEETCRALAADVPAAEARPVHAWSVAALAMLDLGHGRHEAALRRLEEVEAGPAGHSMVVLYCLPDRVEAAVRAGEPERARAALERFAAWAEATGRPWALAVTSRCRALLAGDDDEAERLHARACELHRGDGRPFERARTELLFGELLRRTGRRAAARERLRSAAETFERLDAAPWARRALAELRATGESRPSAARAAADGRARLTPQELQVVRLAATGLSNRDIAAQLFLSPRTVGYHLSNAYPKLGVASRGELARLGLAAA